MPDQPSPDPHLAALEAAVRAAHGAHVPADGDARLRAGIANLQQAVATLRAYPLTNADEPDTLFAAYRRED